MAQLIPSNRFSRRHKLLVATKRRARRDGWIIALFMLSLFLMGALYYFTH